jgi:hypothetical protein
MDGLKIECLIPETFIIDRRISSDSMTSEELTELKNRVRVLEIQVSENTVLTEKTVKIVEEIRDSTWGLVEFTRDAQGLLNVMNRLIKWLKPLSVIGLFVTSVYGLWLGFKTWIIAGIVSGQIK